MYGKQFSNEFLAQQRKDKTGKNNHMSKAILLINIKTNEVIPCESQTQAGKFLGFKSKMPIIRAIKNKTYVYSKNGLSCWKVQYSKD